MDHLEHLGILKLPPNILGGNSSEKRPSTLYLEGNSSVTDRIWQK